MPDHVDTLIEAALTALRSDDFSSCEARTTQALSKLAPGDSRVPMLLSVRGTARIHSDVTAGIADMKEAVRIAPDDWNVQLALGEALLSLNFYRDAEAPLTKAAKLSGGQPDVLASYCQCLLKLNNFGLAFQILSRLINARKATPAVMKVFAQALYQRGDIYGARDVLGQLYGEAGPQTEDDRLQLARIDMSLRDYETARVQIESVLLSNPASVRTRILAVTLSDWTDDQDALAKHVEILAKDGSDHPDAMAQVIEHSREVTDDLLARAEALLTMPGRIDDGRLTLGYALAKHFDQAKDYERAWKHARNVNALFAEQFDIVQTPERRAEQLDVMRRRLSVATRLYAATKDAPELQTDPVHRYIYLVGSARSGSTLLQSILSAPKGVESIGERTSLYPYLADATERDMADTQFAGFARQLSDAEAAGLARMGVTSPLLIEKTPHHLFVAGLLERVNPGSRFVQVFRDAGEVALSMFLRPFSAVYAEASSLDALADMLELRLEVAETWREAGVPVETFSFDSFRASPDHSGQQLFDRIGLKWSKEYLDPKSRPEAVTTFSARQVRKPIYAERIPSWKPYEVFAPDTFARLADITAAQNRILETL